MTLIEQDPPQEFQLKLFCSQKLSKIKGVESLVSIHSSQRTCLFLTKFKDENSDYVVKCGEEEGMLSREIKCLEKIRHPNIIKMKNTIPIENHLCIVLEKARGVSLIELLITEGKFSEKEAGFVMKPIMNAISYLHCKGWIHRDIKPDNIMYCRESCQVKLIDFEFSTKFSRFPGRKLHNPRGTFEYAAPELLKGAYGPESDIWSLGVTLYMLVCGAFPFSRKQIEDYVAERSQELQWKRRRLTASCLTVLERFFELNPKRRGTIKELLKLSWFRERGLRSTASVPVICQAAHHQQQQQEQQQQQQTSQQQGQLSSLSEPTPGDDDDRDGDLNDSSRLSILTQDEMQELRSSYSLIDL